MTKYLVIKPWKPYMTYPTLEKAITVCNKANEESSFKSYIIELDEGAYEYWVKEHNYNLNKSPVVYDPFNIAKTQKEKEFYDNVIFTKPLKRQKGVRI